VNQISRPDPAARARAVAPVIAAAGDAIEREGRLVPAVLDALYEARLFRMFLARAFGGDEMHPADYAQAVEEISRHDGSVGWCVFQACSGSLLAAYMDPDAAREVFADPRATTAWGPPGKPEARAVPGGYLVSGSWLFASGCRHASWMGAHGHVRESDGSLRRDSAGNPVTRSLLFPAHHARINDDWDTIGLRGTASDSYEVDEVFVPEAFSATREDLSARRTPGKLFAFSQQGLYAVGSASVALGLAQAMLDGFVDLARGKAPRGMSRLADHPVLHTQLAQTEARLAASRALLHASLRDAWDLAEETAPLPLNARARVRLAAIHAIETAATAADYAYKAAGADAIFKANGFERRFRDVHTLTQQVQSRLANFEPIGRIMLGGEGDRPIL